MNYKEALALWADLEPEHRRLFNVAEECSELITAAAHYDRRRATTAAKLAEETADVLNMIEWLYYHFGREFEVEVWRIKHEKLNRCLAEAHIEGHIDGFGTAGRE